MGPELVEPKLGIAKDLLQAVKKFFTSLPNATKNRREEARSVAMGTADALQRSCLLAIEYLRGAGEISDSDEMLNYLQNGPNALMHTCNEFKICQKLYDLRDRLTKLLEVDKLAMTGAAQEIVAMLIHRERSVIDLIADAWPHPLVTQGVQEHLEKVNRTIFALEKERKALVKLSRQFADMT